MKRAMIAASAAMISVAAFFSSAGAQGTPQTVELVKVDVQTLAAGYRASKVIGSSVASGPMSCCRSAVSWAWVLTWLSSPMTR